MSESGFWVVVYVLLATSNLVTMSNKLDEIMQRTETDPNVVNSFKIGLNIALDHCQNNFKWDRWNCPREDFDRETFNDNPKESNRESAFIHAIIAAGTVHSVTKNCSKGELVDCGCDTRKPENPPYEALHKVSRKSNTTQSIQWAWGGCSDDITFGTRVASEVLEESQKNLTVRSYVVKHNYQVGKEIVKQTMVKKCRCHGTSGSCSIQTCWLQTAPFKDVSRKLYEKYRKAVRLTPERVYAFVALSNSIKREDIMGDPPAPRNALVYLDESPDYCLPDVNKNWPGTMGRSCSRVKENGTTFAEKKSCRNLCRYCGHTVRREKRIISKRCNCKFQWCCAVKCDFCTEIVEDFYCH